MSELERRQMTIASDLRMLIANAEILLALLHSTDDDGQYIQTGADMIRVLAEELMENV